MVGGSGNIILMSGYYTVSKLMGFKTCCVAAFGVTDNFPKKLSIVDCLSETKKK